MFYVVLVFLGLGAISLPFNIIGALAGSTALNPYSLPVWVTWLSVVLGIPSTALFVWMLVAVIRYGPWAMTGKVESPQTPQPATLLTPPPPPPAPFCPPLRHHPTLAPP